MDKAVPPEIVLLGGRSGLDLIKDIKKSFKTGKTLTTSCPKGEPPCKGKHIEETVTVYERRGAVTSVLLPEISCHDTCTVDGALFVPENSAASGTRQYLSSRQTECEGLTWGVCRRTLLSGGERTSGRDDKSTAQISFNCTDGDDGS